jgi:APA family basic amino acid/polyamine antiporter
MSWLALSYMGFNAAIYVAGESSDDLGRAPRAMLVGTVVVMTIYLLLNYIFLYAPSPDLLIDSRGGGKSEVATIAAMEMGGARLAEFVRAIIVLATCSSIFATLMIGPRVYRQMAVDGVFPSALAQGSLSALIGLQAALSCVAVLTGSILTLMEYLGLTLSACGMLAVGSLWWIRQRMPAVKPLTFMEQFSVALFLSIGAAIVIATCNQRPHQFYALLLTMAVGIMVYVGWRRLSPDRKAAS